MNTKTPLSDIHLQIMWDRLISVVEEQAQTLVRTAFSPIVRESGDLSAGVFDLKGRMLAQAVTGTPGHVNSMARSVSHFLRHFPIETMRRGDVFITNDPWMGTGHLHDMVVLTPAFRHDDVVALFACTSHLIDIGGIGFGPDGRDVFEEGLYLPFLRLVDAGQVNQTLIDIARGNSRYPTEVEGDILSLAACNDIGCERLVAMMDEFGLTDIDGLGAHIFARSNAAILQRIQVLPRGSFKAAMRVDGYERPIDLVATLTISHDGIKVDYTGTSGPSSRGINVPLAYCEAYTTYGVNCLIAPDVPNNAGTLAAVTVAAPEGSILNAQRPAPVSLRHVIGQMLPDVVFGCLAQATTDRVPAEGTSCLWNLILEDHGAAQANKTNAKFTRFSILAVQTGGVGARPTLDGLSATAFPSGVAGVPIEILESISPLVFFRKELRPDSGGAGKTRGGLGQIIEIESREPVSFDINAAFDRVQFPPRGRDGGKSGEAGYIGLGSGKRLRSKGRQEIPAGERLIVQTPGGGGHGEPARRDPAKVRADVAAGLVSVESAARDYGPSFATE